MTIPNLGRGGLPVYSPTGATLSVSNGSTAVSFTGTAFITTDATTGAVTYAVGVGDTLVVSGVGERIIESVPTTTSLVLGAPWSAATQTGITSTGSPGWYIIRNSVPAMAYNAKAIADLLAIGTDATPDNPSRTIDNGVSRIKLRFDSSGNPELAIGNTGTADASLVAAMRFDKTSGGMLLPLGLTASASFRNRIMNPDFKIWQRGTSQTIAHGGGGYLADRWTTNNQTGNSLTVTRVTQPTGFRFAGFGYASRIDCTFDNSGVYLRYQQYIESNIIQDLSGQGITVSFDCLGSTASGTLSGSVNIWAWSAPDNLSGSPNSKNFTVPTTGNKVSVSFAANEIGDVRNGILCSITFQNSAGSATAANITLSNFQLESGSVPTTIEIRPRMLELYMCKRYYQTSSDLDQPQGTSNINTKWYKFTETTRSDHTIPVFYEPQMRINPTVTVYSPASGEVNKMSSPSVFPNNFAATIASGTASMLGFTLQVNSVSIGAGTMIFGGFAADAEL